MDISFDADRCIKCGQCVKICSMGHLRMTDDGPSATGKGGCMGCLQCAAMCPREAVLQDGQRATIPHSDDSLEELIMSRRSIRHYKKELPDKAILEWAIQRAGYAPSGKNERAYHWTVVYGFDRVAAVREVALRHCQETGHAPELLRFAAKGLDLLTCGAPVLIMVWSPDDCLNPTVDPSIALETVELLLVHKGLGTCWGGYMRRISGRCPELRQMLGIPDGFFMRACLMTGIPDGRPFPNIPVRPEPDIYWA